MGITSPNPPHGDAGYGALIEAAPLLCSRWNWSGWKHSTVNQRHHPGPSAEELKKGAKVEVIKPEDIEKAKAEAQKEKKP